MILFSKAREILAKYAGRGGLCPDNPDVANFVIETMQHLLFSGAYGNVHKFCFCAQKGCFTIPPELEVIEKVKLDGVVGSAWDRWYEFHATKELGNCLPAARAVYEEPNYFPTVYDVPEGGARIGCVAVCPEAKDAAIIVKGIDATGREIVTVNNGEQIIGEYLSIQHGVINYTQAMFAQVTGIVKPITKGYVQLVWVNPGLGLKGFMADYSPLEQVPAYRRYRITTPCCGPNVKVSVLGRIRLKEAYADNDIIPFENILVLNLAGQAINSSYNRDPASAQANDAMMQNVIERENSYKKPEVGQPMEVFIPLSGGAIKNIVY